MKRSEAVEALAEKLLSTKGLFGGAADEWEEVRESTKMYRIKIAHNALKAAEELGMLPPRTECHVLLTSKNVWDKEEDNEL